jgi:hypothetical protein
MEKKLDHIITKNILEKIYKIIQAELILWRYFAFSLLLLILAKNCLIINKNLIIIKNIELIKIINNINHKA